mmetsp:Transcript_19252/g.42741  ORF Transcript_19252/g.42741 Transcript_19252/m.42741 type:complete len:215 (+) Transcript_19252:533-1177(+)
MFFLRLGGDGAGRGYRPSSSGRRRGSRLSFICRPNTRALPWGTFPGSMNGCWGKMLYAMVLLLLLLLLLLHLPLQHHRQQPPALPLEYCQPLAYPKKPCPGWMPSSRHSPTTLGYHRLNSRHARTLWSTFGNWQRTCFNSSRGRPTTAPVVPDRTRGRDGDGWTPGRMMSATMTVAKEMVTVKALVTTETTTMMMAGYDLSSLGHFRHQRFVPF